MKNVPWRKSQHAAVVECRTEPKQQQADDELHKTLRIPVFEK
jgi:hypothetical protein